MRSIMWRIQQGIILFSHQQPSLNSVKSLGLTYSFVQPKIHSHLNLNTCTALALKEFKPPTHSARTMQTKLAGVHIYGPEHQRNRSILLRTLWSEYRMLIVHWLIYQYSFNCGDTESFKITDGMRCPFIGKYFSFYLIPDWLTLDCNWIGYECTRPV